MPRLIVAPTHTQVLLVVGDHFSFARGRVPGLLSGPALAAAREAGSLVAAVDAALQAGGGPEGRAAAEALLSLQGGHGHIADGAAGVSGGGAWVVDAATHPWQEGEPPSELTETPRLGDGPGIRVRSRHEHTSTTTSEVNEPGSETSPAFLSWAVEGLGGRSWDVLECSFSSEAELETFLRGAVKGSSAQPVPKAAPKMRPRL